MPVVYSFTASIILPTSTEFPCMDVHGGAMPNLLLFAEVTSTRGAPWIAGELPSKDLVCYSDDGLLTQLKASLPISQKFTIQTNFRATSLPLDLSDLNSSRLFIGAFDKQDNGGGILVSKHGLAIVGAIGSSATVIPGSYGIIEEGDTYYTLRIVVNGSTNMMDVYITKTDDLPITGHILRYTSAAPDTPLGTLDEVRIDVLGTSLKKTEIKLDTLKVNCTECLVPNKRPIADAGADQTANIGSAVTHDGRNSYDPEGEALTYEWMLKDAPDGSRFKIFGTGLTTTDDGDADGYTQLVTVSGAPFSVENAPLLQPGDHLLIDGVYYKVSPDRWLSDPATGKYQRQSSLWVDDELKVVPDTVPDNLAGVSWAIFHTSTYFSDDTHSYPVAIPDILGIYKVGLVVNDGVLDSFEAESLLNINSTSVPLGCIPDVSWIWDHLSDFWELVEDRARVETIWSGFAQAAAAQLLAAWQIDYGKSLLDIQRVFQRRWLSYDPLLELEPTDATVRVIRGPIFSTDIQINPNIGGKTLQVVFDGGLVQTVTFQGSGTLTAQQIADNINDQLGYENASVKLATVVVDTLSGETYLRIDYPYLLQIRPGGSANSLLGFSTTDYIQNDLQGSSGQAVTIVNPTPPPPTVDVLNTMEAQDPGPETGFDFDDEGVEKGDLLVVNDIGYRVQKTAYPAGVSNPTHKRGLTLQESLPDTATNPWLVSSSVTVDDLDLEQELVVVGDLVRFELKNSQGTIFNVFCEVTAVRKGVVGFDPLPLLQAYSGQPSTFTTRVTGIKRLTYIPVDGLVLEVPRLQEIIKNPPSVLDQNVDYTLETIDVNGTAHRVIQFRSTVFAPLDPPPDTLWAEVTYLDNNPTIEANFGRLVNFKLEDVASRTENLDYLSAVRGLWWAYFGGPSLYKVRVGTQILLGLPFAEAEGIVREIDPNFSAAEGRIIIEDVADNTISRTYFYPLNAGLATNENTGELIVEGDTVGQFAPLSSGIEVLDYLKDPDWLNKYISMGKFHELEKYFKFLVRGDVDTFNLLNLSFAIDFVKKIKPHYTHPLFIILKNLDPSEVDVSDRINFIARLYLYESSCPEEPGAYRWDDTDESGNWNHAYDEVPPPPRFLYDKQRLCPKMLIWAIIPYEHPGGAGWYYDTIWAYDDGDTDGDGTSDDYLRLSGPDTLPPAPYGPPVGTITYDATVVAGTYWRSKIL